MLPIRCAGSPAYIAALAALVVSACSLEGGVAIEMRWPEDTALSPVREQVAEIALVRSAAGQPPERTVRQVSRSSGAPIDMGAIEAGEGLRLAVELRSTTQRLIGYGRSSGVIDLAPGDSIEVPIEVRRPFVYVTGNTDVATFDPTRDAIGAAYQGAIAAVEDAEVAVPAADGSALVLAAPDGAGGWELHLLSTSDHSELLGAPIPLPYRPVDLAVSASGRYVVAAHEDAPGGVSVVDLEAAAPEAATFMEMGPVGRVAVAPVAAGSREERAFALVDRSFDCEAGGTSQITAVALDDPSQLGPSITYLTPIQDLTTSPGSPVVVVANRCDSRVERVSWEGAGQEVLRLTLAQLDNVTAVAVLDSRVWAVGSTANPADGQARLLVASMDIDGQDVTYAELPPLQERAQIPQFSGEGGEAESLRQIGADEIAAYDLAVLPGAEFVALLTRGRFHDIERGEAYDVLADEFYPILPELEIWNYEYVLVNTATLTLVQRVRTDCDLQVISEDALITDWACSQSAEQDIADTLYTPTSLSVLYGAR